MEFLCRHDQHEIDQRGTRARTRWCSGSDKSPHCSVCKTTSLRHNIHCMTNRILHRSPSHQHSIRSYTRHILVFHNYTSRSFHCTVHTHQLLHNTAIPPGTHTNQGSKLLEDTIHKFLSLDSSRIAHQRRGDSQSRVRIL